MKETKIPNDGAGATWLAVEWLDFSLVWSHLRENPWLGEGPSGSQASERCRALLYFKTRAADSARLSTAPGNKPNQNIPAMHAPKPNRIRVERVIGE